MKELVVDIAVDAREEGAFSLEVSFTAPPGITILFGPSGAGKSRTLACIAGLARPDRGRIALGDDVWFDGKRSRPIHERRVAYVFQSLALFPHMTALENVAYGIPKGPERHDRALAMLDAMHVRKLADRRPRTYSGGEAQRVALARAFAMEPGVVLLDEPFSALDSAVKAELLREVAERVKVPGILVTHQAEDAEILGQKIVFVERGRVTKTANAPFKV